jgi:glyoxylase-like metal-dependent hydrolase (beta-lactamase superfamily II)
VKITRFTFNPFQENTYIVSDKTGECIIIDPGCYDEEERSELQRSIASQNLKPVRLINTHGHIDHVLGNKFIADTYKLQVELHLMEVPLLRAVQLYASEYGIYCEPSPEPFSILKAGEKLAFGTSSFSMIHVPGHSPGSLCFYNEKDKILIGGDVLFQMSIGRTDLTGGDYETLISSIKQKLFALPDDVTVYPGHGPETTIGFEKKNNPFF